MKIQMGHVTITMPLSGTIQQCIKYEIYSSLTTKIGKAMKNAEIGVVFGFGGHSKSLATLPFDRAHMTSYSTLIETVSILYKAI